MLILFPAAIPPSHFRQGGSGVSGQSYSHLPRTVSSNSTSTILEGLPEAMSCMKVQAPPSVVYLWGGGIVTPSRLPLPQHDSDAIQVSVGRTMKTGVTANGRMIIWESAKDNNADCVGERTSPANVWVPRFLEGQSGVTIVQVSCGDIFTACLTGN